MLLSAVLQSRVNPVRPVPPEGDWMGEKKADLLSWRRRLGVAVAIEDGKIESRGVISSKRRL
jgi:hypothetical protein